MNKQHNVAKQLVGINIESTLFQRRIGYFNNESLLTEDNTTFDTI